MGRCRQAAWFTTILCMMPLMAAAQDTAAAPEPAATVSAVWVERRVSFNYMPITSYYSCDGLRDKVRWILRQLGARPDFQVKRRGCIEPQGPDPSPGVEIVAALPAAATPELLEQLEAEAAKRQLAARATGKPDPVAEATAQFPARVKRVEFSSRSFSLSDLEDGDCELMEQLVRQDVFGKLGARVVENRTRCVPRQVTPGAVRMTVEVLAPVVE
jgi:hypothetical protein